MNELIIRDFFYKNLKDKKEYFYYRDRYRTWKYSFDKILDSALKFASFLKKNGIKKGDRVLIRAKSNPDWIIVFTGCLMYGATVVPLDLKSGKEFLNMVIKDVEPSLFINSREKPGEKYGENEIANIPIIFIEEIEEKIESEKEFDYRQISIAAEDIIEIVYTSGTTSIPKGVLLTYKNIQSNLEMAIPVIEKWKKFLKILHNPKLLSIVPLSHMYGQVVGLFIPVAVSLSVLFPHSSNPKDLVEIIKRAKIAALGALPQQLKLLKEYIETAYGLESEAFKKKFDKFKKRKWWIRYLAFLPVHFKMGISLLGIISGGAQIKEEVDEFYRTIAFGMFQGYGLTETAPLLALFDPTKNKAGSVGSFLDSENIKIEDGELYVRGSNITPGYYKNKQKTEEHFKDGWFKTGDLVEIDESGNVFIRGRKDNVIVKESGVNIYPSDITGKLREQKGIKDCVVFGMESNGKTEIVAVLILKNSYMEKSGVDDLIDRVNHDLNVEQRIDDYLIWKGDDFPRTASMNINKREVLEKLQSSQTGQKAKSIEAEEKGQKKDIYDLIEKIKKTRGKKDRDAALQGDLGMDSLDIISLSTVIEKNYGIDSSQLAITADTKIRDIEEGLKNPPGKSVSLPFFNFAFNIIFIVLRTIFQYLIFPFVRIIYRSKVIGKSNLKDIAFPTAFISNHVSVMDSLVILYALPLRIRQKLTVVMSIGHHFTEFFTKKGNIVQRIIEGLGFYLFIGLYINVIPLSREFGFDQVFKNIGMAVDRGWNVLIFPEGAVTTDGKIKKFEHGIGIICRDMKIPVVPLRIDGLHNILRNGLLPIGHFPRIPVVKITIGKQEYHSEGDYGDIAEKLYNILKEKM